MEQRPLGKTGLSVSVLGFGGSEIGFERSDVGDAQIERLLNALLDAGVTLVDTGECYADSEELIGTFISHRRDEFTLTTKVGHEVVEGAGPDWSVSQMEASIDQSLRRLKTDRVDVIQLHTCPKEMLEQGDVVDVLVRARDAGKTRFIGYSGDNEAAEYAVKMGVFDTLQTSFSVLDQKARRTLIPMAAERGTGIINKRPLANAMLKASEPKSNYSRPYYERKQAISWPDLGGLDPIEVSLRYVLSFPISTAIVGTTNPDHFRANMEMAQKGPLPEALLNALNAAFDASDQGWEQKS
jgi:aryl-alcohol dehydrogenase-like predicted oxidoreductase